MTYSPHTCTYIRTYIRISVLTHIHISVLTHIRQVAVYHEASDDSSHAVWNVPARLGRCRDNVYHDGTLDVLDGVMVYISIDMYEHINV